MKTVRNFGTFIASLLKPHPGRDWLIIFFTCILVLLACIGYGAYLFIGISSGRIVGVSTLDVPKPPQVTRGQITKVLEQYKARSLNFNERNFPLPTLFDPSK